MFIKPILSATPSPPPWWILLIAPGPALADGNIHNIRARQKTKHCNEGNAGAQKWAASSSSGKPAKKVPFHSSQDLPGYIKDRRDMVVTAADVHLTTQAAMTLLGGRALRLGRLGGWALRLGRLGGRVPRLGRLGAEKCKIFTLLLSKFHYILIF